MSYQDVKLIQPDKLPRNPKRGSYYWWAKFCRENTGSHFLDSGSIYGYAYDKHVVGKDGPHVFVELWGNRVNLFQINTVEWLYHSFEAEDRTAIALERLFYWFARYLYNDEWNWYECLEQFKEDLPLLPGYVVNDSFRVGRIIEDCKRAKPTSPAPTRFPVWDFWRLEEAGLFNWKWSEGFNTYNFDTDLDQVIQVPYILGDHCDGYYFIQAHTGCDARGGYTSPVVAHCYDGPAPYQVEITCQKCNTWYEDIYAYQRELEAKENTLSHDQPVYQFVNPARRADPDTLLRIPTDTIRLWCPECNQYSAIARVPF